MLTVISQQMMTNYQDIQQHLAQTDLWLSTDLAQIIQDNENFKNEIRQELLLMGSSGSSVVTPVPPTSTPSGFTPNPPVVSPSSSAVPPIVASSSNSTTSSNDFQTQMMVLLNETFSKFTTVISDSKSADTKSDWRKFVGDMRKF